MVCQACDHIAHVTWPWTWLGGQQGPDSEHRLPSLEGDITPKSTALNQGHKSLTLKETFPSAATELSVKLVCQRVLKYL